LVDDPFKDFAYELDIASRKSKPINIKRPGQENEKAEDEGSAWFSKFLKDNLKFFGLMLYFLSLYIITESYEAYSNKESDINYNSG
jgi:hypothetical protein